MPLRVKKPFREFSKSEAYFWSTIFDRKAQESFPISFSPASSSNTPTTNSCLKRLLTQHSNFVECPLKAKKPRCKIYSIKFLLCAVCLNVWSLDLESRDANLEFASMCETLNFIIAFRTPNTAQIVEFSVHHQFCTLLNKTDERILTS